MIFHRGRIFLREQESDIEVPIRSYLIENAEFLIEIWEASEHDRPQVMQLQVHADGSNFV